MRASSLDVPEIDMGDRSSTLLTIGKANDGLRSIVWLVNQGQSEVFLNKRYIWLINNQILNRIIER
jgi:hypothetical protein